MLNVFFQLMLYVFGLMATPVDESITNCHTPTTEKFALMASADEFMDLHLAPLAYVHVAAQGEMVVFDTPDGRKGSGYMLKASQPSGKWLFVFQEWWGLNEHIKREADKLFNDLGDVNVIALDLYDGKVADNPQDARAYIQAAERSRIEAIIKGASAMAGPNAKIGTIGWCFGGMWSLQAALLLDDKAVACVVYYGTPEQDVDRLKTLKTDVLGIFAAKERNISPAVVAKFEENMQAAGKRLEVYSYDAEHAFANPSNPAFDPMATEEAYGHTMRYLRAKFGY